MAERTVAEALELIREELGLADCPKPRQVVQRACETLGLGLEASLTLRQQVQEICVFCDIPTGWADTTSAPSAVAQPDPPTASTVPPSPAQAEEGVPPLKPTPGAGEARGKSEFLLMVVPCKPLVSVGSKLRLTASDLPELLASAAQKLELDAELDMSIFDDKADAQPLLVTSLDQVPSKAKVQLWPKVLSDAANLETASATTTTTAAAPATMAPAPAPALAMTVPAPPAAPAPAALADNDNMAAELEVIVVPDEATAAVAAAPLSTLAALPVAIGMAPEPEVSPAMSTDAVAEGLSRGSGTIVSQSFMDKLDQAIEQAEALQPYSCRVTGAETVRGSSGAFGSLHTEYQIELLWGPRDGPYQLIRTSKRYSDFHQLDKALRPLLGPNTIPKLPKKAFNKNGENVVRQRMELLRQYLDTATRQVAQLEAYMAQSATAKKLVDEFLNATVLDVGPAEADDAAMVVDSAAGGSR